MKRFLIALACVCLCGPALGQSYVPTITNSTGTVTVTGYNQEREMLLLDWTSASNGAVYATINPLNGELLRVNFKPDSGGTQPSNAYDVVLNDADGIDVLGGTGANLSNSTAAAKIPVVSALISGATDDYAFAPYKVNGSHILSISNAGNAKGGTIRLFFRRVKR